MVESRPPANPLFLREEELRQGIELMFYAYRDFTFESDQQLRHYQLGRAHHRALYFIGRHPGQTVGHLLSILKVTKQSISRVLKDLIEQGYVEQKSGARDRRERLLWLTDKGQQARARPDRPPEPALRPRLSRDRRRGRRRLPQGAARAARPGRARDRRQAGARRRAMSVVDASADKPHILVVDDDTRLRELLSSFLSQNGFRVSTAGDAAEARQRLAALDFDLIVLDVMMPGQTGLDFAGELRRTDDVPILMLTAMGEPKDRIAGLETGVDDYLGKPFEPRELLLRIQSILRRKRTAAAAASEPQRSVGFGPMAVRPRARRAHPEGRQAGAADRRRGRPAAGAGRRAWAKC